jgi:hypothetical protein
VAGWLENEELDRILKEVVMALSRYHPGSCLQGLSKTINNVRITGVPAEK